MKQPGRKSGATGNDIHFHVVLPGKRPKLFHESRGNIQIAARVEPHVNDKFFHSCRLKLYENTPSKFSERFTAGQIARAVKLDIEELPLRQSLRPVLSL